MFLWGKKMSFVIGVAGCSGSGKTTVSELIAEYYKGRCVVISADDYYLGKDKMKVESFDNPDAIDFDLLASHIQLLKQGKSIQKPNYDFKVSNRTEITTTIEPQPIIIIEGILVLHPDNLRKLMDESIFVDTDLDTCRDRRVARDIIERGRTREHALDQWYRDVVPAYKEFVEPSRENAKTIIDNTEPNSEKDFDIEPVLKYLDEVITGKEMASEGRKRFQLFAKTRDTNTPQSSSTFVEKQSLVFH